MATIVKKKTTKKKAPAAKKKVTKSAAKKLTALQKMELFLEKKTTKLVVKDMKINLDVGSMKKSLPHLPTGSIIIDHLIGGTLNKYGIQPCPGIPRGKLTQVYGPNSCGKTTLALTVSAITCSTGGTVLYIDLENEIDPTYAAHLGVPIGDDTKFTIYAPDTLEEVIALMMVATTMGVDLIVIDSVGAGITKETYVMSPDDIAKGATGRLGQVAAAWSKGLTILKPRIARAGTAVLGISQMRSGGPGTNEHVIQGGKAWEFFTSVRLKLARISWDKESEYNAITHKVESDVRVGAVIRGELQKCKVSRNQGLKQDFYIRHGEGIDDHHSIFDIAVLHNVIVRTGSQYKWGEHNIKGKNNALNFIRNNQDEFFSLYNKVIPYLSNTQLSSGVEVEVDEDDNFGVDEEALVAMVEGSGLESAVEIAASLQSEELAETEEGDSAEITVESLEEELDDLLPE